MRALEFRAWDKKTNNMVDIQSIHWGGVMGNVSQTAIKTMEYHMGACAEGDTLVADRYGLMQYTGLNDKNNVRIFEGHLVVSHNPSLSSNRKPMVIGWTNGCFTVYDPDCCETCRRGEGCICNIDEATPEKLEVIGNIHQNQELLGGRTEDSGANN